jgi:hypothetical protein
MAQESWGQLLYRESRACGGDPFPEIAQSFENYDKEGAEILDLGCGQTRTRWTSH